MTSSRRWFLKLLAALPFLSVAGTAVVVSEEEPDARAEVNDEMRGQLAAIYSMDRPNWVEWDDSGDVHYYWRHEIGANA